MGTKALHELLEGGDYEAPRCKGSARPIDHEWHVFIRVGEGELAKPIPGIQFSQDQPKRYLRVLCKRCKADGAMGCYEEAEWEGALRAVLKPYELPHLQSIRVKDIHQRRREEWEYLTGWQYVPDNKAPDE